MDERDNLTVQDEEFEKLLREGLTSSYREDGLCVSEDLIARTLKAIADDAERNEDEQENEPEQDKKPADIESIDEARKLKTRRFIRIAGGIAAALAVGVIGISVFNSGTRMQSSAPKSDVAFMMDTAKEMSAVVSEDTANSEVKSFRKEQADSIQAPMTVWSDDDGITDDCDMDEYDKVMDTADESEYGSNDGENSIEQTKSSDICIDDSNMMEACDNAGDYGELLITGSSELDFKSEDNYFHFSGDESAGMYDALYNAAINECTDVVYELVGFMTDDRAGEIPDDLGDILLTVTYISSDCWKMETINVYEKYCDIHDDRPLSSNSADYSSVLYRIDDGEALAETLRAIMDSTK